MEEPIPSAYRAFLVVLLAIGQIIAFAAGGAHCWGGCASSVISNLIVLGLLAAGSLLVARSAYVGLTEAGSINKPATIVFLIPSVFASISGLAIFILGVMSLGWYWVVSLVRQPAR